MSDEAEKDERKKELDISIIEEKAVRIDYIEKKVDELYDGYIESFDLIKEDANRVFLFIVTGIAGCFGYSITLIDIKASSQNWFWIIPLLLTAGYLCGLGSYLVWKVLLFKDCPVKGSRPITLINKDTQDLSEYVIRYHTAVTLGKQACEVRNILCQISKDCNNTKICLLLTPLAWGIGIAISWLIHVIFF